MNLSLFCAAIVLSAALAGPTPSQPPPQRAQNTDPQASPGAAYQQALRPLTITRASVANWSLSEQAALGIAIKQAAEACAARSAADWTGDSLADLGHLCALGQSYPAAIRAADAYLKESAPAKPRLAEVYAIKIDAELRLKDEKSAFTTAQEMLSSVPYSSVVGDATSEAINYMQLLYTTDAEALAAARQPKLLLLIQTPAPANKKEDAASTPDLGTLFQQALVLPELQQLAGDETGAATSVAGVNAALPSTLGVDDQLSIAGWRKRYAQLGQPLGSISALRSLTIPAKMPQIPAHRAITVLLLFPDWCPQCLQLAAQIPESVFTVEGHEAYMYGLLVETVPAQKPPPPSTIQPVAFNPAYAASLLQGTPTIVVGSDMLDRFHAVDVPLLIVTDSHGIVRLITPADETALRPGNTVDSAVAAIGKQWPTYTPPPNHPGHTNSAAQGHANSQ